jgi:amino acid permease
MHDNFRWLMQIGTYSTWVIFPIRLLVSLFIAVAVYRNGKRREALEFRIPPIVWAVLVLAEPALGLFVYWFMNRDAPYRELDADQV